jgi:hypothetical protein
MTGLIRFVLATGAFYMVYLALGVLAFGEDLDGWLVLKGAAVFSVVYTLVLLRGRDEPAAE